MLSPILAIAIMAAVSAFAVGTFAILIIGIRKGDRGGLSRPPRCLSDAFARRFLAAVKTNKREVR